MYNYCLLLCTKNNSHYIILIGTYGVEIFYWSGDDLSPKKGKSYLLPKVKPQ